MRHLILITLCLLPFIGASDFVCRNYTEELCSAGDLSCCDYEETGDPLGGFILDKVVFTCEGRITEWTIGAAEEGTLYACVWEPYQNGFKLLGYNKLVSDTDDTQTFAVPYEEQITVREGYRVGVVYDEKAPGDLETGILWAKLDDSVDDYPAYLVNKNRTNLDGTIGLHVGDNFDKNKLQKISLRTTIEAKVKGIKRPVRLWSSSTEASGRAELLINGSWGTFCDKWVHLHGWPLTFCRCMGLPGDIDVRYVRDLGPSDPHVDPNNALVIHKESPNRCTVSWDRNLDDCPVHPKGTCGHDLDVFAKCSGKWRCAPENDYSPIDLGNGCRKVFCRPQYWIETLECWSNVCELRGDEHLSLTPYSWITPFCKAVGYSEGGSVHFEDATLHDDETFITDVTCPGGLGTSIKDCQTRFRKDEGCPLSANSGLAIVDCIDCPV